MTMHITLRDIYIHTTDRSVREQNGTYHCSSCNRGVHLVLPK